MTSGRLNASSTQGVQIPLDSIEEKIFSFIRETCAEMPERPVARVAGGWVRDKILGKASKDIDIAIDVVSGVRFAEALTLSAQQRYGTNQRVVSTVNVTEARPEQIKNLEVAFLKIFGQDIEILNLRAIEYYKPGDRNPIVVRLPELIQASSSEGIPALVRRTAPHMLPALSKLDRRQRNEPTEVLKMLDAHRRDLTINSMFYNVNLGSVENLTGQGLDDIGYLSNQGITLRTPLEPIKTFTDDPLRLLRVLRFLSRYPNAKIAPEVIEAMRDPEVQHQITRRIINSAETQGIVVERTAEEMRKLMQGQQPEAAIRVMYETGLLSSMLNLPGHFEPLHMDQRNQHHELTVIEHTLEVLKNVNNLSQQYGLDNKMRMFMNFSALFHDFGKLDPRSHKNRPDGTRGYSGDPANPHGIPHELASDDVWRLFAQSLQFSNDETETIASLVSGHMRPHAHVHDDVDVSDRSLRKYLRTNPLWTFQYIHAMADAMSKTKEPRPDELSRYETNLDRLRTLAPSADTFGNMPPAQDILNGREIMQIVGLPPAPPPGMVGYIEVVKERIRENQDENPNLSKEDATRITQEMVQSGELDAYRV